jgi:hypothetical protein
MKPNMTAAPTKSAPQSGALYNQSDTCVQRCRSGINQTAERSVTRMSDKTPQQQKRKMSLTKTPN